MSAYFHVQVRLSVLYPPHSVYYRVEYGLLLVWLLGLFTIAQRSSYVELIDHYRVS